MSKQIINVGQSANDRSGDPLRNAFEKVNSNFTELYNAIVDGVSLDQVNSDWNAVSGVARILNKPTIPTNTNQLTNGAGFITDTDRIVNGAKEIVLDANGSLTVPYPSQESFRIRLSSENFVPRLGKATLTLTGTAWDFYGAFANSQDGQRELIADSGPLPSIVNPGYEDGDTFEIDSTAHGVVGFILTVILNDVVQAEPAGWTANLAFSPPPDYPSTINSLGAVKITANTNSLILGTDGTVTVSGAIKQGLSKLEFNANGGTNVYLTPTTDDSTAVFVNQTSVQAYATETVSLQVGAGLGDLEGVWIGTEAVWVDTRDQDAQIIAPATRPWAGMSSYDAYPVILNYTAPGGVLPTPNNLPVVANSARQAYLTWQAAIANTGVGITVGNNTWTFDATGALTTPDVLKVSNTLNGSIVGENGLSILTRNGNQMSMIYNRATILSPIPEYNANVAALFLDGNGATIEINTDTTGNSWHFKTDGTIEYPGGIKQGYQDNTTCPAGVDTVIYTATTQWQHAIKLFVMVEGTPDGGTLWETQACDIIAVRGFTNDIVHVTAYGVTYSSASAFATFDGQWNATNNRIEITCRPTSATNNVRASVHAIEMSTND